VICIVSPIKKCTGESAARILLRLMLYESDKDEVKNRKRHTPVTSLRSKDSGWRSDGSSSRGIYIEGMTSTSILSHASHDGPCGALTLLGLSMIRTKVPIDRRLDGSNDKT